MTPVSIALCMPVGPQKISPTTVYMIGGMMHRKVFAAMILSESHVVPARNSAWQQAIKKKVDRVLWCDSDVACEPDELIAWIKENESVMKGNGKIGAIGSIVARRGPEGLWNYSADRAGEGGPWLGMGLCYWHVPRVLAALEAGKRDPKFPFRWIPPHSEDYEISQFLGSHGAWQSINPNLTTHHDGVGTWEASKKLPGGSEITIKAGKYISLCSGCGVTHDQSYHKGGKSNG